MTKAWHAAFILVRFLLTNLVCVLSLRNSVIVLLCLSKQEKGSRTSINWERRQGRIVYCASGKFVPRGQEEACRGWHLFRRCMRGCLVQDADDGDVADIIKNSVLNSERYRDSEFVLRRRGSVSTCIVWATLLGCRRLRGHLSAAGARRASSWVM